MRDRLVLGLFASIVILALAACTTATPTPTPAATNTPEATNTPQATATPEPTSTPAPDVAFQGVSFSFDKSIASAVISETIPATDLDNVPEWESEPEHTEFSFDGYALQDTFHKPRINVYPIAELESMNPGAPLIIADLRDLLTEKPSELPRGLPFLPTFNAGQLMHAEFKYLDFENGTGVRYLTQFAQYFAPINNEELIYTYQGFTDDGQYYISAILPVSHPILPADASEIPGGDFNAFADNYDTYIEDLIQQLETGPVSSFTPALSLLDAMIQSLLAK
jgi:hypothetical protein